MVPLKSVMAQESIKEETESIEAKSEGGQSMKNHNLGDQTTESEEQPKPQIYKVKPVTEKVTTHQKPASAQASIRRPKGQRNLSNNPSIKSKASAMKSARDTARWHKMPDSLKLIDHQKEDK